MNARRKEGKMSGVVGMDVKNAATSRKGGETQASQIKNANTSPKTTGMKKIKNSNCVYAGAGGY